MFSQSSQFAEVFCYLRDEGRLPPEPVVKQHKITRIRRGARTVNETTIARKVRNEFVQPERKKREISQSTLDTRASNEFHKRMIADLGGSLTVMPSDDGTRYNAAERGLLHHVEPVQKTAATDPWSDEAIRAERRKLDQRTNAAKADVLGAYAARYAARFAQLGEDCGF